MIDASWQNPDGSLGQGTFEGATLGFSLHVCEGCDELFSGSLADDFDILLGAPWDLRSRNSPAYSASVAIPTVV